MAHPHRCTHDHAATHVGSPTETLAIAEKRCAARGLNLTGQRRQVLAHLLRAGRVLGAYDLIERMATETGKRVAPITVYRALEFLVEAGLVHRIESRNAFLACPSGHGAHAQAVFMICDCCGRVVETASAGIEAAVAALAQSSGFAARSRVIELTGLCADCAGEPSGAFSSEANAGSREENSRPL